MIIYSIQNEKNKKLEEFEDNKHYESWWDEMIDFSKELTELIYTDLKNSYLFITENKNYIIWSIIAVILLQITSIDNLGKAFEKTCPSHSSNHSNKSKQIIQKGGEGAIPNASPQKQQQVSGMMNTIMGKPGESELQQNEKRLGFFQNLKAKFSAGGDWGGKYGLAGPVFGNFEKIWDNVKYVFYILFIILVVAGVLSIPALLYMVLTYCIIKYLVSLFTGL